MKIICNIKIRPELLIITFSTKNLVPGLPLRTGRQRREKPVIIFTFAGNTYQKNHDILQIYKKNTMKRGKCEHPSLHPRLLTSEGDNYKTFFGKNLFYYAVFIKRDHWSYQIFIYKKRLTVFLIKKDFISKNRKLLKSFFNWNLHIL